MKVVIVYASSKVVPTVITLRDFTDVIGLFKNEGSFIFEENFFYKDTIEDIMKYCEVSIDDAQKICKCRYEIRIYDDYIE